MLNCAGNFEICVHDDGSSDPTAKKLSEICDPRLSISSSGNQGRARALATAVARARGRFIMLFDDDDDLSPQGLWRVLSDCEAPLPESAIGYVYHLMGDAGETLGSEFPVARANLLKLRKDLHVKGDKKEVVLSALLKPVVGKASTLGKRVPTSLYWSTLAMEGDVICRNLVIGRKSYLKSGMSDQIRKLKRRNSKAMVELYKIHVRAFLRKRYSSSYQVARSAGALVWYMLVDRLTSFRLSTPYTNSSK
jgi:glycosyltransferase involved in cell wall biosynthesis